MRAHGFGMSSENIKEQDGATDDTHLESDQRCVRAILRSASNLGIKHIPLFVLITDGVLAPGPKAEGYRAEADYAHAASEMPLGW